jgi:ribosomal protein L7Ae-like RNA K-turn-binding protein
MDKAQSYLGLARKAGLLSMGEDGCGDTVSAGRAKLLLLASDASPGTVKRAKAMLAGHRAPMETLPWERETLSALLGKAGCSILCFTDLPLAARFAAAMADASPQWGDTAELLARREEKAARRKAAPRKHERGGT